MSNKRMLLRKATIALFVTAITFGSSTGTAQPVQAQTGDNTVFMPLVASSPESLDETALLRVADDKDIPVARLEVVASADVTFPLSGATFTDFKIADSKSGELYSIALDAAGNAQNVEALLEAENAAYEERYGKLDVDLAEYLAENDEPVEVLIWLDDPATEARRMPLFNEDGTPNAEASDPEAIDAFMAEMDAARAEAVAATVAPVAARFESLGIQFETNDLAPVVSTTLNDETLALVESWPEVDRIYRSIPAVAEDDDGQEAEKITVIEPELEISRGAIYATVVHGRNIQGHNSKIAQIEVGGRVSTNNPFLDLGDPDRILQDNTFVCAAASGHSTGVAGIMVSSHPTRYGVSPGAFLRTAGSCGGSWAELSNRSTAAVNWGARAINNSWGSNIGLVPGAMDRFYDTIFYSNARLPVKSTGNEDPPCGVNSNVTSPGLGYNILSVGNFDDRNTIGWGDDVMDTCSSWRDPISTHNDREKPEVAAPGANINSTTTAFPWTGNIGSGTSFAAPHVTAAAALLFNRNSSLVSWPEATKAILMATARNNIEGASRLSELDGAGGIVLDYADDVARGAFGSWGARTYSCATASPLIVANMSLVAGKLTRVVIVWDQNPNYVNYAARPSADLDLRVINAGGVTIASSLSWDNTYEIVEFVPPANGTYRIRVNRVRCDLTPSYLGWAWHRLP